MRGETEIKINELHPFVYLKKQGVDLNQIKEGVRKIEWRKDTNLLFVYLFSFLPPSKFVEWYLLGGKKILDSFSGNFEKVLLTLESR